MEDYTLHKGLIDATTATAYFNELRNGCVVWYNALEARDGSMVALKREMAYVSDEPVLYKYANLSLPGQTWVAPLLAIKTTLENAVSNKFNSVLLNHYRTGRDIINWHSDREEQLSTNPVISCVNLGAGRTFHFLEKATGIKSSVFLENGDLLVMHENCQENYLHAILKEPHITEPRISLTFRLTF